MVNLKKLITGFLLLSVLTSLVIFAFSGANLGPRAVKNSVAERATSQIAATGGNVFLPGYTPPKSDASTNYENLTSAASRGLGLAVLSLNPEGLDYSTGEPSLLLPDEQTLAQFVALQAPEFKFENLWVDVTLEDLNVLSASSPEDNRRYADSFEMLMEKTISNPQFLSALRDNPSLELLAALPLVFGQAAEGLRKMAMPKEFAEFHRSFLAYVENQKSALQAGLDFGDPLKMFVVRKNQEKMTEQIQKDFVAMLNEYVKLDLQKLLSFDSNKKKNLFEKILGLFSIESASAFNIPGLPSGVSNLPGLNNLNIPGLSSGGIPDQCNPVALRATTDFLDTFGNIFSVGGLKDLLGGQIPGIGSVPGIGSIPGLTVPVNDVGTNAANTSKNTAVSAERLAELVYISSSMLTLEIQNCITALHTDMLIGELNQIMQKQVKDYVQNSGTSRWLTDFEGFFQDAALEGANTAFQEAQTTLCPEFQGIAETLLDPGSVSAGTGIFSNIPTSLGGLLSNITSVFSGGLGNFGFSSILGLGGAGGAGCSRNFNGQVFYDDFDAGGGFDAFLSLLEPDNNFFGSFAKNSDVVTRKAAASAEAAKAQSIASQGFRDEAPCVEYGQDSSGNQFCKKREIITPGSVIQGSIKRAIDSRFERVLNAKDFGQLVKNTTEALGTQLIQQAEQGLYAVQISGGNCFSFNPGGIGGILSGGGISSVFNYNLQGCAQLLTSLATNQFQNILSSSGGGGGSGGGLPSPATSTTPGVGVPGGPTTCAPSNQTVDTGENATLTASGGNGTYFWSATGGNPSFQTSGATFTTSYALAGSRTVSVASNGTVANCTVTVEPVGGSGGVLTP